MDIIEQNKLHIQVLEVMGHLSAYKCDKYGKEGVIVLAVDNSNFFSLLLMEKLNYNKFNFKISAGNIIIMGKGG